VSKPLISIVMPVYNSMPYLEMAIKSIFAQTISDWELIVVDDGSTDDSWRFVNNISDSRVKLYKNKKTMGHSWTCNFAISNAIGKYIAKMDADDISFPDRLEKQLNYLKTNPDVDVISCGLIKIDNHLNIISMSQAMQSHKDIIRLNRKFIFGPNIFITDGALFGRIKWFQKWPYDANIKYSQDFDLLFRAKYHSIYSNIQDSLYIYRKGGETASIKAKSISIKNKFITITKYGFKMGDRLDCLFAILSLIIRFFVAILTPLFLKLRSKLPRNEERHQEFINIIRLIDKVEIPINIE